MKKIYLILGIFFLLLFVNKVRSEPVNLYGFTPASVDSVPLFQPKHKPMQREENVFVTLRAEIDKKGKIKSLKPEDEKDSLYYFYVEPYMQKMTFKPAVLNNKKIKSVLPIEIVFSRKIYSPVFRFPLLQDTLIVDNELFERTCKLNNMVLPKVLSFPSYFSDANPSDSSNRYPYVVEKISCANGKIIGIESYMSTHDAFIQQIQSAILYADIQLPKINGEDISGELYLMVSFFPQLSYPVASFNGNSAYSSNLLHRYRIRIINKYSHLLSEPIPKRVPSDKYPRQLFGSSFNEPIKILIQIDTLGKANVRGTGTSHKLISKSIRKFVSRLRFFPAINQKNELEEFRGYLKIEPFNKSNIRISYLWMN